MIMKEEVIVKSLAIKKIGEKLFFQVSLPHDTKRIIGIEYGAVAKEGIPLPSPFVVESLSSFTLKMTSNVLIGRLTLRTAGCTGIFYQDDIVEDQNIGFGETIAPVLWIPSVSTHGRRRHEMSLSVCENRMIHGFYEDSWGIGAYQTLSYILKIYIWIEKCIK